MQLILPTLRSASARRPDLDVTAIEKTAGALSKERDTTGQVGADGSVLPDLALSTMLLSQMVEEKSNKIIEVVAAAVPIEVAVRRQAVRDARRVGPRAARVDRGGRRGGRVAQDGRPRRAAAAAVGWPTFLVLTIVYFAMNYLLLGAVFLTIGAQASTVREVQTLSMPVTFGQVLIFGFAAAAVGNRPIQRWGSRPRPSPCPRRWR